MIGEELGYIVGDDKVAWRRQIDEFTQGRFDSMDQMDDTTRSHWLIHLRMVRKFSARKAAGVGQS